MTDVPAPAPPPPKPGWKTSEAWITFAVAILCALPSSGLIDDMPTVVKIVGLIIAGFAALGYTTNRTALKRAHVEAI